MFRSLVVVCTLLVVVLCHPHHKPGVNDHKPGVHNHKPGVHNHKPGVHNHKPGVHDHKPGVHNHKPGYHTYKSKGGVREGDEKYYSWTESKGYPECKEFIAEYRSNYKKRPNKNNVEKAEGKDGKKSCPKPLPIDEICDKFECPPYKRMNSSGCGFETRLIYGAKWVGTDLDDIKDVQGSTMKAFWRLVGYTKGGNDESAQIEMTVPVLYKWYLDENYEMTGGRMHFYIPAEYQTNTPKPSDKRVSVEEFADQVTYDRAFGGDVISPERYLNEFKKLGKALGEAGMTPDLRFSMTLGYTRPGYGKQRMEVMFADN